MKKLNLFVLLMAISITFYSCDRNLEEDLTKTSAKDVRAAKRPIGTSAREILTDTEFTSIELEIQYVVGFEPHGELINDIKLFLEELIHKPGGVEIYTSAIAPINQESYTLREIRDIEDANRNTYNVGKKLGMYILFLDGYSSDDTNANFTFALVHRNTSVAMFAKRMRERSGGLNEPSRALLEKTVTRHELGHLMGLVNVGSGMVHNHEDERNPGHCDNTECLMYWAVESRGVLNMLDGKKMPVLDENCRKDLKANGGK